MPLDVDMTSPLAQMVREAYATHPTVWARTFPDLADDQAEMHAARERFNVYLRCVAFELGHVYPNASNDARMRPWVLWLGALREEFRLIAEQHYGTETAVIVLVRNVTNNLTAPEWAR